MYNAKRNLINGTIIYFIGNALISLIQLLLLPIVTGKLEPEAYGYFDLIITSSNLIIPILTLQITDAVFRFFFDADDKEKKQYFTSALVIIIAGICLLTITIVFINIYVHKINYLCYILFYFISNIVFLLYTKMSRSLGKSLDYVRCNLVKSILYIIFQIVFLLIFKLKIESLFLASILSTLIAIAFLEYKVKLRIYWEFNLINKNTLKEMLYYSLPLIPNSLLWWLISSINTYIITFKLGMNINGIYTVSNKFSSILTMITSVFLLSWQESIIREFNSKEGKKFCDEISYQFINVVFSIVAIMIPLIRIIMPFMINENYYQALNYSPVLLLGTAMAAISGFYGSIYSATKNTMGSMKTTIYGVIANLLIVIILIDKIGLYAPALGTLMSNFCLVIARHMTFKEQLQIKIRWKYIIILFLQISFSFLCYYINNIYILIAWIPICLIIAMLLNMQLIKEGMLFILNLKIIRSKFKIGEKYNV